MKTSSFEVIGYPSGIASKNSGCSEGILALRSAHLISRLTEAGVTPIVDGGDIETFPVPKDAGSVGSVQAKYLEQVKILSESLFNRTKEALLRGNTPIVIGGDHSLSIGSVSAVSSYLGGSGSGARDLGLLWVDAHADINIPETSPSGNIHGMPVAVLLGLCLEPLAKIGGYAPKIIKENIVYIGLRDLDKPEKDRIKELGIKAYSMKEIDLLGIGEVCRSAFSYLSKNTKKVMLSFDLDVVDPLYAPGVGTPVRGGLTERESHLIMEMAYDSGLLMAIDLVEYNPLHDPGGATRELSIRLLESVVGKGIL